MSIACAEIKYKFERNAAFLKSILFSQRLVPNGKYVAPADNRIEFRAYDANHTCYSGTDFK